MNLLHIDKKKEGPGLVPEITHEFMKLMQKYHGESAFLVSLGFFVRINEIESDDFQKQHPNKLISFEYLFGVGKKMAEESDAEWKAKGGGNP